MAKIDKWDGVMQKNYNPFAHTIETPSPSVNYTFGKSHGLPLAYSLIMYGPPKCGKSVLSNYFAGHLHKYDPEALVIKFDTEFREGLQGGQDDTEQANKLFGIDPDRIRTIQTNSPSIFDTIEHNIAEQCEEGAPIKLIIIDSITQIQGRRGLNNESIMDMTIGDVAQTLQEGFKRILPVQRKYKFAVIATAHVRAELDQVERMRGNTTKMSASWGVQHYAEYFMHVQRLMNADGKVDELGNKFEDDTRLDFNEKPILTGHKIKVTMKGSSADGSCVGRTGEFLFDYKKGIINQHEELFTLSVNQNIIHRPNNRTYEFGGKTFTSKEAFLLGLRDDNVLYNDVLKKIKELDLGIVSK